MASLLVMSCLSNSKVATTITWIEDKPGPTVQEHKIFPAVPDSLWEVPKRNK